MISKEVFEYTLLQFLEPIRPFLEDASVSEVMINGPFEIFIERKGILTRTDAKFSSQDALEAALRNLAQFVGRHVDVFHPILEGRLPDGSRVEAVFPPAAPDGPCVAIRRFSKDSLTVDKLVGWGSLNKDALAFLREVVNVKLNVLVAGGTGSGKTSMLNALSSLIPEGDRIVVIEDSREVQLQKEHVVQLEARPPDARGRGQVTIRDLFKATLRMRPDRIVVGEIRGGEALELIQAMTSGHGGCMSTIHATYPKDTLARLETMAMMSDVAMPLNALRAQIASAVDIIVQTARIRNGARCVTHISEVQGFEPERGYAVVDLFRRSYDAELGEGLDSTQFKPTGTVPKCLEVILEHGGRLPAAMIQAFEQAKSTP